MSNPETPNPETPVEPTIIMVPVDPAIATAARTAAVLTASAAATAADVAATAASAAASVAQTAATTAAHTAARVMQPPPWPRAMVSLMVFVLLLVAGVAAVNTVELASTRRAINHFTSSNTVYLENHARTQRILCDVLRANHLTISVNPTTNVSDCDGR